MYFIKIIILTSIYLLCYSSCLATKFDNSGVILGSSYSKFSNNNFPDENNNKKMNIFGSFYYKKQLNELLDLQIEFSVKQIGSQLNYVTQIFAGEINVKDNFTLTNIEIPILLNVPYYPSDKSKMQISFGTFIGYNIKSNRSGSYTVTKTNLLSDNDFSGNIPNTKKIQYGLNIGFDYRPFSKKSKLFLSLRYGYYFSKVFKENSIDYVATEGNLPISNRVGFDFLNFKHNQLSLGLGWKFGSL